MTVEPPVLIRGQGVLARKLARNLHNSSSRAAKIFVEMDCRLIVSGLYETELFGHLKGTASSREKAGSLEQASGGTLFIDNIDALDLAVQWVLLTSVREGGVVRVGAVTPVPIDVRLIAATPDDLTALVAAGKFRADLCGFLGTPVGAE